MTTMRSGSPFDSLTPGVKGLLLVNGGVFLAQMLFPNFLIETFALMPARAVEKLWIWQLVTYSFLHGSFWHLFFNMFALWMFGPHIESYWGTPTFLRFYFLCVLGAAVAQCLIAPASVVVGASGGLYGLLLAFGFLFPDAVIYLFFFFPLRAIQAVIVISAITFASALQSGGEKVAHLAHLGGLVTGFLYFKVPVWITNIRYRFGGKTGGFKKFEVISPDDNLTKEVDRILDKISAKGLDSLTEKEHETMRRYGKKHDE